MASVLMLVRAGDWWGRKITPVLAFAYLQLLLQTTTPARAWGPLAALLFSATALAAAAHVLTDSFDVAEDRRAGKRNGMAFLQPWQRGILYAGLGLAGVSPWLIVPLSTPALVWLGLIVAAPILYAVPPLRLKERGLWGALADATMAHGAPTLFVLALFAGQAANPQPGSLLLTSAAGVWAWSYGLRGILLHQMFDAANDEKAEVNTFVRRVGIARTHAYIVRYVLRLEFGAYGVLLMLVLPVAPLFSSAILGLALLDVLKVTYVWRQSFDPAPIHQGAYIFPQAVYEIGFPLAAVILLAAHDHWYGVLLLLHVGLFHRQIASGVRDAGRVVGKGLSGLRRRAQRLIGSS